MSDEELDTAVSAILISFPKFGRRMIHGHLKSQGHNVPEDRIRASYIRVHGVPAAFGPHRRVKRRVYSVPGPMSLVHHDGQHGTL